MPAPWTSRSDGDLLRHAREEPAAFAELYRRHEPIVVSFLARRTRDAELTADLAAETFAVALLNAQRFTDTGQSAVGWLLGIARNQHLDTARKSRGGLRALQRLNVERPDLSDTTVARIEELAAADTPSPQLARALQALPADQRDAIEAYVLREQPYAELATELGVPEATVRQRVSRGLARLRNTIEGTR
jgi:RNA polymerase sigma-70 factor (ECF subfamily)